MIDVQIVGLEELVARLESVPSTVWARIGAAMDNIVDALAGRTRERMASLFKNSGGRMPSTIYTEVDDGGQDSVEGRVGASGLPYLAIQEFGGVTRPHDIFPRNARALAFFWPGGPFAGNQPRDMSGIVSGRGTVLGKLSPSGHGQTGDRQFFTHVFHPGSQMPERSYLRSALALQRNDIVEQLNQAVQEGVDASNA